MTLRKTVKHWFYGRCPGFAGSFPYYGARIYFPKGSLLFRLTCEQGVYESHNVDLLASLAAPGKWYFDVGTNLGLMSVPVLSMVPDCRVLSFEPSPGVLPYLQRTMSQSPHAARWTLVPKATGAVQGRTKFNLSASKDSPYDGIRDTQRVPSERQVDVELTTIDAEWKRLGSPPVSAIKLDVEGAEYSTLQGARECLLAHRPAVLLEWNAENLKANECPPVRLLELARELDFQLFALPHLVEVRTERELELHMKRTESFLLSTR